MTVKVFLAELRKNLRMFVYWLRLFLSSGTWDWDKLIDWPWFDFELSARADTCCWKIFSHTPGLISPKTTNSGLVWWEGGTLSLCHLVDGTTVDIWKGRRQALLWRGRRSSRWSHHPALLLISGDTRSDTQFRSLSLSRLWHGEPDPIDRQVAVHQRRIPLDPASIARHIR